LSIRRILREISDEKCFHEEADEPGASAGKTDDDGSNPIVIIEWNSAVTVSPMLNA
jgi:hypothetical protein